MQQQGRSITVADHPSADSGPRDCNHSPIAPDLPPNSIRSSDRLASWQPVGADARSTRPPPIDRPRPSRVCRSCDPTGVPTSFTSEEGAARCHV